MLVLLRSLGESVPAVILGRRGDILAWNSAGYALTTEHLDYQAPDHPHTRPSVPRMFFLDLLHRDRCRNWDNLARIHIAYLRPTSDRYPADARLTELIGELVIHSTDFSALCATRDVADCATGPMDIQHPTIGGVDVDLFAPLGYNLCTDK